MSSTICLSAVILKIKTECTDKPNALTVFQLHILHQSFEIERPKGP